MVAGTNKIYVKQDDNSTKESDIIEFKTVSDNYLPRDLWNQFLHLVTLMVGQFI